MRPIIAGPSSTAVVFGMKAHIAVDADSGQVHTVTATTANEADVEQAADLLHGKEEQVWPTLATGAFQAG